jgi:alkylhydroperoxidase/carboxymuconolactone decarboxylase family protein YurZ
MYDPNNIKKLGKYDKLTPDVWKGFLAFNNAAMADGAIPAKTKELIAIAVAMTTQCAY